MTMTDPLFGALPTWRMDDEPIYLQMVEDYGLPWLGLLPAGRVVK